MKLKAQKQAVALRKKGYSMREISEKLEIAKSSISLWVRNVPLSVDAKRILNEKFTDGQIASQIAHRKRTAEKLSVAQEKAKLTINKYLPNKESLQIACALLYWCEGTKSRNDSSFIFTNSDPNLIKTFLYLLRSGFGVDESKFRVCVHLHDYHNERKQLQFWSKVTNMPLSHFIKSYRKHHTGKQIRDGYAGCVSVRYYDVEISRHVQAIARMFLGTYTGP